MDGQAGPGSGEAEDRATATEVDLPLRNKFVFHDRQRLYRKFTFVRFASLSRERRLERIRASLLESVCVLRSCVVQDRDLVLDAFEDAQRILAEHIEPASRRNPETTINMLLFLLDRREVVAAV